MYCLLGLMYWLSALPVPPALCVVYQVRTVLYLIVCVLQVHVWLVAHPKQILGWRGDRPTLQDISGGANFWNKTDNGIVVHRDWAKLKELQQRAADEKRARTGGATRVGAGGAAAGGGQGQQGGAEGTFPGQFEVFIHVDKVRNKTTGAQGQVTLVYDRVTGRYHEEGWEPPEVYGATAAAGNGSAAGRPASYSGGGGAAAAGGGGRLSPAASTAAAGPAGGGGGTKAGWGGSSGSSAAAGPGGSRTAADEKARSGGAAAAGTTPAAVMPPGSSMSHLKTEPVIGDGGPSSADGNIEVVDDEGEGIEDVNAPPGAAARGFYQGKQDPWGRDQASTEVDYDSWKYERG